LCYQFKSKIKVMKKLIFAAYTIALTALVPLVFVSYLHGDQTAPAAQKEVKVEKAAKTTVEAEASYPVVTLFVAVK
jgi:Na+/H+ antiporter NhaC